MDLRALHSRLSDHFEQLRQRRLAIVGSPAVFALEHGLANQEIIALKEEFRTHRASSSSRDASWLPWIVYAAEFGYLYAGDEYWQTFEADTAGWAPADREWLRTCFARFHARFQGAKPRGKWADHFTIISWPITHAILPKDLQLQLAQVLYQVRHSFSEDNLGTPEELGELVAANCANTNSRFQNLAEEPLLLGQIATALLVEHEVSSTLLLPQALQRIANDLEEVRQARDWLSNARTYARARFRGLRPTRASRAYASSSESARQQVQALGVEPRLVARPRSMNAWEIWLEIPDYSPLLARFSNFRTALAESRCVVAGSSGQPLWQGKLLRGPQPVRLHSWPAQDRPLLQFEQTTPELDFLLRTECLLRPGAATLFRIGADGLGYELRSKVVRPGKDYILVSTETLPRTDDATGVALVEIACQGVTGVKVSVPPVLSPAWEHQLTNLGLSLARSIRVWPAGVSAAMWDGEGQAEWLSSDQACLAVSSDHAVAGISLTLEPNPVETLTIPQLNPGETRFIQLPPLSCGMYRLTVNTLAGSERVVSGTLDFSVRAPRIWKPGQSLQGAMIPVMDPPHPSLEQLRDGRAAFEVLGPSDFNMQCNVILLGRRSSEAIARVKMPLIQLPCNAGSWRRQFEKTVLHDSKFQNSFDSAQACTLECSADELGGFSITCERELTPFRWAYARNGNIQTVELLDDRADGRDLVVEHCSFEHPDIFIRQISPLAKHRVMEAGGMFVARGEDLERAIVVAPTGELKSLSQLSISPQLIAKSRTLENLKQVLSNSWTWSGARLAGNHLMAAHRRDKILDCLCRQAFALLGGDSWGRAERAWQNRRDEESLRTLKDSIANDHRNHGLGAKLFIERKALANLRPFERANRLAEWANSLLGLDKNPADQTSQPPNQAAEVIDPSWACGLAIRLACGAPDVQTWSGRRLWPGLDYLWSMPILARAARWVVIAVNFLSGNPSDYARWEWQ